MVLSIVHRATGIALYAGMALLALWFAAAALGSSPLGVVHFVFASWLGQFVLFGLTWSLCHHMLGGIRHFVWDLGLGFDPVSREWLVRANLIGGIVLTLAIWAGFVWFK